MLGATKRDMTNPGANPMTTFNTNTDTDARDPQGMKLRAAAETRLRHVLDDLAPWLSNRAPNAEREIGRASRREAARRAVDNLLR
jgi:hypothetical protein